MMAVTRTHRVPNPGSVSVSPADGEFLLFRVEANGPMPRFQFTTDVKGQMLNQGRFPSDPAPSYEWTYLRDPSDIQQFELLSVSLLFAANTDYRYIVEKRNAAGVIRRVIDISYRGPATDFDTEVFRVLIV
jgi:hypothetical protein